MANRGVERIPITIGAGGRRIGEIVINRNRARQAIEYLAHVAYPVHTLPAADARRITAYALRHVHEQLKAEATSLIERSVWQAFPLKESPHGKSALKKPKRGRPRRLEPRELRQAYAQLRSQLSALAKAFKSKNRRGEAWRIFVRENASQATILDEQGFKAQWLSQATDARELSAARMADAVLARAYGSTVESIRTTRIRRRK